MEKKRKRTRAPGDLAEIRQACNCFIEIDPTEFASDPERPCYRLGSSWTGGPPEKMLKYPVGAIIELVYVTRTRIGHAVRVFRMPDGKLGASYGGSTRDYKWCD